MSMRPLAVLLTCLALIMAAALPAGAADPQKKPEDFRDIKWGAAPSSLPGLVQVDRDGDIIHYERPDEKKDLGGVAISHVTYSFYKNQFYHAEIDYDGKDAAQALQRSLEAKYGPPDAVREKKDPNGHAYEVAVWDWPGYAFIGNRHDKDGGRGRVFYFYAPLTDASAKGQGIAPAPASAARPAPVASGRGYTVKKGDILARVAKHLGVTEAALVAANPGLTEKTLRAGAQLAVPTGAGPTAAMTPGTSSPAAPPGPATEYTVKAGDVLSKVANAHGVRTKDVIAANPGIDPDNLRLGTVLRIPVKKPEPAAAAAPTPSAAPSQEAATPAAAAP